MDQEQAMESLRAAIKQGDDDAALAALAWGLDVGERQERGQTLLMKAAQAGLPGCVQRLIDLGADPRASDLAGKTALHGAKKNCVAILLGAGANPDAQDQSGTSALMRAAWLSQPSCVGPLIEGGADPNLLDANGQSALRFAIGERARELLAAGADVDARDHQECTALALAARDKGEQEVKILIQGGASLNLADANGWTPAHWAASRGKILSLRALFDAGADMWAKEEDGRSPLDLARGEAMIFSKPSLRKPSWTKRRGPRRPASARGGFERERRPVGPSVLRLAPTGRFKKRGRQLILGPRAGGGFGV